MYGSVGTLPSNAILLPQRGTVAAELNLVIAIPARDPTQKIAERACKFFSCERLCSGLATSPSRRFETCITAVGISIFGAVVIVETVSIARLEIGTALAGFSVLTGIFCLLVGLRGLCRNINIRDRRLQHCRNSEDQNRGPQTLCWPKVAVHTEAKLLANL